MTWFKVDDQWLRHPKTQALSKDGKLLWLAGGLHCAAHLTDGVILKTSLRLIAAEADVKPTTVAELIAVGLWHEEADRYVVHQWLDYQPSRESVEGERAKARERMKNKRSSSGEVPPNVPPNNGRSSASQTRPDQTRPYGVTSQNKTDRQDTDDPVGLSVGFLDALSILTAHAEDTATTPIVRRDRWTESTQRNITAEKGADIERLLDEGNTPQETAEQLTGDGLGVRNAMRKRSMEVHPPKGWEGVA